MVDIELIQHCARLMGWRHWESNDTDTLSAHETLWAIDLAACYRLADEEVVPGEKICLVSRPTQYSNGAYNHHFRVWRPDRDYNDAVELRTEIAKQGLEQQFVDALYVECGIADINAPGWSLIFALACATPEQTARAFVTTMEQEHE